MTFIGDCVFQKMLFMSAREFHKDQKANVNFYG